MEERSEGGREGGGGVKKKGEGKEGRHWRVELCSWCGCD